MKTEFKMWGNSPALRVPKALMEQCKFSNGSPVNMEVIDNKLVIELDRQPELTLEMLLETCTPENTKRSQEEQQWLDMEPVGKEII